jgi:hypothetical protein
VSVRVRVDSTKLESMVGGVAARQSSVFGEWQRQGSAEAVSVLRANSPVRSGFLRNSVQKEFTQLGFRVFPSASYAAAVEYGSKPHTIFPSKKRVLSWVWGGCSMGWTFGNNRIFACKVEHPGFAGRFFIRKSRDELRGKLRDLYLMLWSRMKNE